MDSEHRSSGSVRCRSILLGVIVVALIAAVILAIGLHFGLDLIHKKTTEEQDKYGPMEVLSVRSNGLVGDSWIVTVTYFAASDHTAGWRLIHKFGHMIHYSGKLVRIYKDEDIAYENSINIPVRTKNGVFFFIRSGTDTVHITFNHTALKTPRNYTIPPLQNTFAHINSSVMAPETGDMTIPVVFSMEPLSNVSHTPFVYIVALNSSANPPTVFEEYAFNEKVRVTNVSSISANTTKAEITLDEEIVKYGGLLVVRLREKMDPAFLKFEHGVSIEIVPPGKKELISNNVVGLYPLPTKAPFFTDVVSITCYAMGNPAPNVKIIRQLPGNIHEELKTMTAVNMRWSRLEVVTLHDKTTQAGNYTCSARSGTAVATTTIELYTAEVVKFLDNETGVVENTTNKIVVQCAATGIPIPSLTFRLFDEHGPDMIASGRYEHSRNVTDNVASLTMTITPVDVGIDQVYCVGQQIDERDDENRLIVLFPDPARRNYTLYNELVAEAT